MRREVSFQSRGETCAGWLFLPDDLAPGQRVPGIVMANSLGFVKEMLVPRYAERFAAAGFAALLFDYRFLGESGGEPRGQIFPQEQQEDIRNGLSFMQDQPEVDPERLALWGVSYGGAHVLPVAAYDRRVKAVVSTVPYISAYDTLRMAMGAEGAFGFLGFLNGARVARYRSGSDAVMPLVSADGSPSMGPDPRLHAFYTKTAESMAPTWRNLVTVESIEKSLEYRPASHVHLISPTPLLMVIAQRDEFLPADLARAAFEAAGEPKRKLELDCGHADVYAEPNLSRSSDAAIAWFQQHVLGAASVTRA